MMLERGEQYDGMETLPRILLALAIALVALALAWGAREISENGRYALHNGDGKLMFLVDSKTGKVWAYWMNLGDNGALLKQGFSLIERHGSMRGSLDVPADATNP
jgi:hypothetical protein